MMKKLLVFLCMILLGLGMLGVANATVVEWGSSNEMFYDTDTELYWYDPIEFQGWSRADVEAWLAVNPQWSLATTDQVVSGLYESLPHVNGDPSLPSGFIDQWSAMGVPTLVIEYSAPDDYEATYMYRGIVDPVGSADVALYYEHIIYFGETWYNSDHMGYGLPSDIAGAWLYSVDDPTQAPVPEPATMFLLGSGLVGLAGFGRKKFKK